MAEQHRLRTKKLQVFLSENEYQFLKEKANYCGINLSEFIRGVVSEGAIIKYATCDIQAAVAELNHIGNNLNQIAKKVNATSEVDERDFWQLQAAYDKLFDYYIEKMVGMK